MNAILSSTALSALIAIILGPIFIPILHKLKFGQSIRDEGPAWHAKKSGTPTMGGIIFIISACASTELIMLFSGKTDPEIQIIVITSLLFGVIGFIDDFIKVVLKRNLGLTSSQKFLAQILAAVLGVYALSRFGSLGSLIKLPFYPKLVDIGLFVFPLAVLVHLSVVNSVNLTDGLDGLAATVTLIVGIFLTVCAFFMEEYLIAIFIGSVSGGCLGFLAFNRYPAKVFMGDTGSLFLGGAIGATAIALGMPVVLIIAGGVYLLETLSVILQVASFKLTGKRIFKMSPIHHHFEMCGFSEKKIVFIFSVATIILCAISFFSVMNFF
ncbi:MAG: phospho-N-acetylmuramoyl-pentapeptide-transferase [Clostridia bacterium]|nr:phospho-N-acetylmuramoyl-pentapeptide-transferase [Clostridia bacterium]